MDKKIAYLSSYKHGYLESIYTCYNGRSPLIFLQRQLLSDLIYLDDPLQRLQPFELTDILTIG